ncbi:hypothetical protein MKW98_025457 [Papaver atlanticum]|uniref:Uncharacterized protein n=1 Tax=Papaver atlanticum TaxID=357466 RepID=A0AAD4XD27_9MAGN|nr:hypothetical protein MKW98_025457 [Papaver atlanticum]
MSFQVTLSAILLRALKFSQLDDMKERERKRKKEKKRKICTPMTYSDGRDDLNLVEGEEEVSEEHTNFVVPRNQNPLFFPANIRLFQC